MMRKLVVMVMAVLFSLSVSGVSFAQQKPAKAAPANPCADKVHKDIPQGEKVAPAQPCAGPHQDIPQQSGRAMKKKAKKTQALADKKAACLEKATTDEAKAECEKKFAEKAKTAKKATKKAAKKAKEEGATMAPDKSAPAPAPTK